MPTYAASLIARRRGSGNGNGHLGGLIRQLDDVLYACFVVSYVLDANFLNLVIKSISQLQLSAPKEHHPDRSLRFHIVACFLVNILNIIYHLGVPLTMDPRGIIIDFVGQSYLPSRFQILIMDLITTFLQAFMIILAYEVGHYGKQANLDDSIDVAIENGEATVEDEAETDSDADSEGDALLDSSTATKLTPSSLEDRPILYMRPRQTLRRIMQNKPVPPDPISLITGDSGDTAERLRIIQRNLRRRRRQRERQRARDVANGTLIEDSTNNEVTRTDVLSDEERDIDMPWSLNSPVRSEEDGTIYQR